MAETDLGPLHVRTHSVDTEISHTQSAIEGGDLPVSPLNLKRERHSTAPEYHIESYDGAAVAKSARIDFANHYHSYDNTPHVAPIIVRASSADSQADNLLPPWSPFFLSDNPPAQATSIDSSIFIEEPAISGFLCNCVLPAACVFCITTSK